MGIKGKDMMGDNVKITINESKEFTGRLIGLVDNEECRAIMNVKNAARKIFTSETLPLGKIGGMYRDRRFIVATTHYSSDKRREIFISPTIKFLSFRYGKRTFECEDGNKYTLEVV